MHMKNKLKKFGEELLKQETTLFGKIRNVVFTAVLIVLWTNFVLWLYKATIPEFGFLSTTIFTTFSYSPEFMFVVLCIFAPLVEEYLFRKHLSVIKNIKIEGLFVFAVIFSSIIFGIGHKLGIWAAPIQGVGGLLLCGVYIKNGYSYWSSVATHFLINFYFYLNF